MSRPIIVAGAGIAGLTTALAFAQHGFDVVVLESAPALDVVGSGLQLSANATRILHRLGVLDRLLPFAVKPQSVSLRDGRSLRELARIPLGDWAEKRWGAPYLAVHRADLQRALLEEASSHPHIEIRLGTGLASVEMVEDGATITLNAAEKSMRTSLLVGADGVHSQTRQAIGGDRAAKTGTVAWRRSVDAKSPEGSMLGSALGYDSVAAILRPRFHLIAYPVRAGQAFNLVAFTGPQCDADGAEPSRLALDTELGGCASAIAMLSRSGDWTAWPLFTAPVDNRWTAGAVALIGDAAHAMTPYAAQGAAMAIEDAYTLAQTVAFDRTAPALRRWETSRRARIAQVVRRAGLNKLAWHASGPVALARNLVLSFRGDESLAADLDWLYGWRAT